MYLILIVMFTINELLFRNRGIIHFVYYYVDQFQLEVLGNNITEQVSSSLVSTASTEPQPMINASDHLSATGGT